MTQPAPAPTPDPTPPPPDGRPPTFTEVLDNERTQVQQGAATGCGFVDPGCHGGLTCIRAQHDEATVAHVGIDTAGKYLQWMPPCPPPPSTVTLAAPAIDDGTQRRANTEAWIATHDMSLFAAELAKHLGPALGLHPQHEIEEA